tara:strand:- start:279 stop:434 length:156 start_codon:yes stop_codon:yes gene_type:complete
MQHQKTRKKKSKKRTKKTSNRDWLNNAYDPTNPLTQHYITTGAILPEKKEV